MKWTSKYVDILFGCELDGICGRWWGISTVPIFIGACIDLERTPDDDESDVGEDYRLPKGIFG